MDDDVPAELRAAAAKRRREVEAEMAALAAQKDDGVTRRSQLKRMTTPELEALADAHGVDLSTVPGRDPDETGCPICDRTLDVEDAPIGVVSLMCDEHAEAVTQRVAAAALRPILPPDFHDCRPRDLLPRLRNWAPHVGGVYLYGPMGTGKSHMAAALCKRAWSVLHRQCDRGDLPRIVWRNVTTMMDDIAETFGTNRKYDMRSVANAQVLVLDEIGFADCMPFAVRKLYAVIEHRLQHRLCTIVTSNRDLDQLGEFLGAPQIASRLTAMCAQVDFNGMPDRRIQQAPTLDPPETT